MPSVVDENDQPVGYPEIEPCQPPPQLSPTMMRAAMVGLMRRNGVPMEKIAATLNVSERTAFRDFKLYQEMVIAHSTP